MFKRIIWATDGSEAADRALPIVRDLGSTGATVTVMHGHEFAVAPHAPSQPVHPDELARTEKIERQLQELRSAGVDAEIRFESGAGVGAATMIVDAARAFGADLIVVGTRGYGAVRGMVVGSVTQRLLHVADCPVLVVPAS